MRVLLIDDDPRHREAARRALQRDGAGHEIVEATTAAEGVDLYHWTPFDVVLLGYRLPDADGLETLRALRRSPEFQSAVLLLTDAEDEALAEACLDEGAQDFLVRAELDARHLGRALKQAGHRFRLEEAVRRHHDELRSLAERDPLTGLSNRLYFDASLRTAMPLALRHGEPLALMMLDVDQFKYVNDSFGHDVGDQLLREVSRRLQGALRAGDLLCRLGGDEFAVLLPQTDLEQARIIVDRLRTHMPALDGVGLGHHGLAIGVASWNFGDDELRLLSRADAEMYADKRALRLARAA